MTAHRFFTVAVLAVALLTACGGGNGKASTADPPATKVLSEAAAALKNVKSVHFKLEHENGTTSIPLDLQLVSAEGDLVLPDRLAADIQAKLGTTPVSVKVIGIGSDTWITNPFSRQWTKAGGISIRDIADPAALIDAVIGSVSNAAVAGHETVDGVDCYRLTGKLDSGALAKALGATSGRTLDVQAWVGVKDSLARRIRITGQIADWDATNIVRIINLTKYGQPVTIQPPS